MQHEWSAYQCRMAVPHANQLCSDQPLVMPDVAIVSNRLESVQPLETGTCVEHLCSTIAHRGPLYTRALHKRDRHKS